MLRVPIDVREHGLQEASTRPSSLYGRDKPALIVARPGNGESPTSNGATVGFAASSTAEVDAFHAAGLPAGGTDEGAPGPRGHLPGAYAAYLRDPAGNKVCAYTFTDGN